MTEKANSCTHLVVEGGGCSVGRCGGVGSPVGGDGVDGGGPGPDAVLDVGEGAVEGHHAVVLGLTVKHRGRSGAGPVRKRGNIRLNVKQQLRGKCLTRSVSEFSL